MENSNQTNDMLDQHRPKQLPGMLNVLTILTFIGCGYSYFQIILGLFSDTEKNMQKVQEMQEKMPEDSFLGQRFAHDSREWTQLAFDYNILLLFSAIIFTTLCLWGAIWMRKRRKTGFYIYLIGELAPIFLVAGLLNSFSNMFLMFQVLFVILFVTFYLTQLKHLVNK